MKDEFFNIKRFASCKVFPWWISKKHKFAIYENKSEHCWGREKRSFCRYFIISRWSTKVLCIMYIHDGSESKNIYFLYLFIFFVITKRNLFDRVNQTNQKIIKNSNTYLLPPARGCSGVHLRGYWIRFPRIRLESVITERNLFNWVNQTNQKIIKNSNTYVLPPAKGCSGVHFKRLLN